MAAEILESKDFVQDQIFPTVTTNFFSIFKY